MQNVPISPYNQNIAGNMSQPVKKQDIQRRDVPKHYTKEDENPISRRGEMMKSFASIFVTSAAIAGYVLFRLMEFDINPFEIAGSFYDKVAGKKPITTQEIEKFKNTIKKSNENKFLKELAFGVATVAGIISGFALLCTIVATPKVIYNSKVNAFQKSKEMDVYIKGNRAEKELYNQLDEQAKEGNDKEHLKEEYMQLAIAKNQVPDFVLDEHKSHSQKEHNKPIR